MRIFQVLSIIGTLKILFVKLVVLLLDFIMAYVAQIPQKWCEVLSKDPQLFVRKLRPCMKVSPIIKGFIMCKFAIGDEIVFSDRDYAERIGAVRNLGKQGTVTSVRFNGEGFLIKVRFSTHNIMNAFDHRFSFSDGMNKTAVERKIASMYTRQPYYKTIKGNKSCPQR